MTTLEREKKAVGPYGMCDTISPSGRSGGGKIERRKERRSFFKKDRKLRSW